MNNFSIKLKEVRKSKGISQTELANLLGTKQQSISKYEQGLDTPSLERLIEFAQILNVTLDELVEFERIHHKYSHDLLNKTKSR